MTDDQNAQNIFSGLYCSRLPLNLVLTRMNYSTVIDYFTTICMRNKVICLRLVKKNEKLHLCQNHVQANTVNDTDMKTKS